MGIRTGIGGPWKAVLLLAVGGAGGAAAIAVATVPDNGGVIHACVQQSTPPGGATVPATSGPNLRIIDTGAGQTCNTAVGATIERAVSWNAQGRPGTPGANGKSVTVVSGHTLTIAGGQVITVGGLTGNTLTINAPAFKPSGNQLTLQLDNTTLPILAISFFNHQAGSGTGGSSHGGGKANIHEIALTRVFDKKSPKLALACSNGTHFKKGIITIRKATGFKQKSVVYTLTDVLITSYQAGGHGSGKTPTESFTLDFAKESIAFKK